MKTEDIKKMAQAFQQVQEASKKKMDPVDKSELKGSHADRKDKDIDNDGDVDKSDEYLHNRRKTVNKAMKSKGKEEVETQSEETVSEEKPGLWANIRAKRARGEKMRKKGEKGAPTQDQIRRAQEEVEYTIEGTVYERILENRAQRYRDAAKADDLKDNDTLPGKGAKEMDKDLEVTDKEFGNKEKESHDDASKANRAGPVAKKRSNDQSTGDKAIVNPVKGKQ